MNDELLRGHLQNHWFAATAGVAAFERVGRSHGLPQVAEQVWEIAAEIAEDRATLRDIMLAVGATPSTVGTAAARAAEFVCRLKPNGRIVRRSPLTDVVELEALRTAVVGKRAGWEVLRALTEDDDRLDAGLLDGLLQRADEQYERLRRLHLEVFLIRLAG